jgi:Uma2 family endonuclease
MARAAPNKPTLVVDNRIGGPASPMSATAYERFALEDSEEQWELWRGFPRKKPGMTWNHGDAAYVLGFLLGQQVNWSQYRIRVNAGHLYLPAETYYIPDVLVVPIELGQSLEGHPNKLEVFREPLPLVVEIWSPSTGDYDMHAKIP